MAVQPAESADRRASRSIAIWQLYFGLGLVKTTEDFGSQGDAPVASASCSTGWPSSSSRRNWDVKALQKLIVTSATYRQCVRGQRRAARKGSRKSPAGARPAISPACRNGSRQRARRQRPVDRARRRPQRFSLSTARAVGRTRIGETFTAQEYHESQGADLYRRSMYTFWKRTVPPAALTTFDAPDREKCTARRARSPTRRCRRWCC